MNNNLVKLNTFLLKETSVFKKSVGLFTTFLQIGTVSFGGFMSLISVIEKIIVEKRKMLSQEDVLDGITIANLIPGAMAVNVVAYIGYRIAGIRGAFFSMLGVILPSFILVVVLAEMHIKHGDSTYVTQIFLGITPAVAAIVSSVAYKMLKKNVQGIWHVILIVSCFFGMFFFSGEVKIFFTFSIIFFYGLIGYFLFTKRQNSVSKKSNSDSSRLVDKKFAVVSLFLILVLCFSFIPFGIARGNELYEISTTFSGLSVVLFGGGYVFIPMMQDIVVEKFGWLTDQQFIEGIAIGQVTPGPIVITVAFIGYYVKGIFGALVATISMFTPSAILMILATKMIDHIKYNPKVMAVMQGVRLAIIGMIVFAVITIMGGSVTGTEASLFSYVKIAFVFILSFIFIEKYNLQIIWVIMISGVLGYLMN